MVVSALHGGREGCPLPIHELNAEIPSIKVISSTDEHVIHGVDCVSAELDDETAPEKSDELAARMKERVSPNSIAFSCVALAAFI